MPIIHCIVYMVHLFTLKYTSLTLLILKNHWSLWESVCHAAWASQAALVVKKLPANAGGVRDADSIPGSERSPGGGHGNPLQYSCLENPLDRGAWQATVHRVAKSWTRLKQLSMKASFYQITLWCWSLMHCWLTCVQSLWCGPETRSKESLIHGGLTKKPLFPFSFLFKKIFNRITFYILQLYTLFFLSVLLKI